MVDIVINGCLCIEYGSNGLWYYYVYFVALMVFSGDELFLKKNVKC